MIATVGARSLRDPQPVEAAPQRYVERALLGTGGMGEVQLVHDRQLQPEVALERLRPEHLGKEDLVIRFLREAQLQAQLDHPASPTW